MPKRKRSQSPEEVAVPGSLAPTLRTIRAESKLQDGIAVVQRALKLAAGSERLKMGRRRKTAEEKKDNAAQERLNAENQALKELDLRTIAGNHLCKIILKIKSISSSPALPATLTQKRPPISSDAATLNVTARLYKADGVRKAVTSTIEELIKAIAPKNQTTTEKSAGSAHHTVAEEEASSEEEVDYGFGSESDDGTQSSPNTDAENEWSGISDSEGEAKAERSLSKLQSHVAARKRSLSATPPPPSASAFLPTLTMGGYWSGSDSEPEDDIDVAPKKNRRGQRARQALWEKKYGAKAKHVQTKPKDDRSQGWDPKRGAQLSEGNRTRRGGPTPSGGFRTRESHSKPHTSSQTKPQSRDDQGPVHPSWEAAKKAKEQKQTAAFTGKKITFD